MKSHQESPTNHAVRGGSVLALESTLFMKQTLSTHGMEERGRA